MSGRRQPYPSQIPSMRPAEDHQGGHATGHTGGYATGYSGGSSGGHSATPIYDALYAEYLRSFRALPGDRSGEEELGFTGFGTGPYGARHHTPHYPSAHQHQPWQPQTNGRQHGHGGHLPAALPPAPRREH